MVRFEFDLDNPPPLTPEQEEGLRVLAAMPDDQIDFLTFPSPRRSNWRAPCEIQTSIRL